MTKTTEQQWLVHEERVKNIIHRQVKPLEDDFKNARNWVLSLIATLLFVLFGVGVWVGSIDNRVDNLTVSQIRFEDRIETRLVRIESLILQLTENLRLNNH